MEWQITFALSLLAVSHITGVTSNRERMSYDFNKHDDTECHVLNQVQSSMIRILSTHIEYGKSIEARDESGEPRSGHVKVQAKNRSPGKSTGEDKR